MPLVMFITFYLLLVSFPIFFHFDKLSFILPIVEESIDIRFLTKVLLIVEGFTFFGSIGLDFLYQSQTSKLVLSFNMICLPLTVANYFRAIRKY